MFYFALTPYCIEYCVTIAGLVIVICALIDRFR